MNRFDVAVKAQDAHTLSSVVNNLKEIARDLNQKGDSEDDIRCDAAVVMLVAKLADMAGISFAWPETEWNFCRDRVSNATTPR